MRWLLSIKVLSVLNIESKTVSVQKEHIRNKPLKRVQNLFRMPNQAARLINRKFFTYDHESHVGCLGFHISHLKKSHNSAAASISACHAFLPCPNIVAAISSYRYFPLIRSAALRNTAARSANGRDSHADLAVRAKSIALDTSDGVAFEYLATIFACTAGFLCTKSDEFLNYRPFNGDAFRWAVPNYLITSNHNRDFQRLLSSFKCSFQGFSVR
jgi:hypothetical protein